LDKSRRVFDPANRLLWRLNPRRLQFEELRDSLLLASGELELAVGGRAAPQGEESDRRTAYRYVDRYELPYRFRVFDFANPDFSTAKRESSIVAPQALHLMNDPWVEERAAELSRRATVVKGGTKAKLGALWAMAYHREPEAEEQALARELLERNGGRYRQVAHGLLLTNEFLFVR